MAMTIKTDCSETEEPEAEDAEEFCSNSIKEREAASRLNEDWNSVDFYGS